MIKGGRKMMKMKKTVFGSEFACFKMNSYWWESAINNQVKTTPFNKEKTSYGTFYNKCEKISIIQIQQENENFMIEYVKL